MNTDIFILTYRRERVRTYESLPENLKKHAVLVVDMQDKMRLRRIYPGVRFLRSHAQGLGIGEVRQWLFRWAHQKRIPVLIMLDDDLHFYEGRWKGGTKKFRLAAPDQIFNGFVALWEKASHPGVAFTTCSTPFFNRFKEKWLMKRVAHSFFINMKETWGRASFLGTPVMVDIKFSLDCYTKGLASYSSMWFAARDHSASAEGGVNALGNRGKKHEQAARILAKLHPRYVTIVDRPDVQRHVSNIGTTVDIRLYLVKAYKEATRGQR